MTTSVVDLALAVVGTTAGAENGYEELIASGEAEQAQRGMVTASGCGLVVRGLWRRWLEAEALPVPTTLRAPYKPGSVLATLLGIARAADALAPADAAPEVGDIVWLDAPEHVELWVGDGWRIAGGQRDDAGVETVLCVRRGPADGDAPAEPSRVLAPRRVLRLVRWSKVAAYLEAGF